MTRTNGSALALAARLRLLDDAALIELIRSREFREAGTRDFFDLADRLLDAPSVHAALATLDRPALIGLTRAEATSAAINLGLAADDGTPYDAVAAALSSWPSLGLPGPEALSEQPPDVIATAEVHDHEATDRAAAERAFATTTAIVELLAELGKGGARQLVKGGIALPDARRLAAATGASHDELPVLLAIAASADLVTDDGGPWMVTPASTTWLDGNSAERWVGLARAWFAHVPPQIRDVLSQHEHASWGDHLVTYTRWLYPANADAMHERTLAQVARAELLGIAADGKPSTAGIALLDGDAAAAEAAVLALFPPTVDKAYIQRDLSIVSTGPLDAAIDSRLRTMAEVESAGLATTWRISAESIEHALASGDTAASVRSFLEQLSLTGIPQPLDYLIDETERRHGLVRVGSAGTGSYVRSEDTVVLRQIAVDRMIANLGLRPIDGHLESRFDRDLVYWTLVEGRYPVAAEDSDGATEIVRRTRKVTPVTAKRNPAEELVTRLRAGTDDTSDGAWLERQLEVAVRGRTLVTVTVAMPSGEKVEYVLEPTGIGGGRLRGRDKKADIERTLPLTSIVDVKS
jgi:hypothetical protein